MRILLTAILASALIGCASLVPKSFNQKLAAGYVTVTTVADSATILHQAGKLSDSDRDNIAKQDQNAKEGLDIARALHSTEPASGDAKLSATLTALTALKAYLDNLPGAQP